MIIFINGAFGVGKTTAAKRLVARLDQSVLFDPEHVGFVLQRLPCLEKRTDDFQDMPLWRALTVHGIRLSRLTHRRVVVPMAFSNLAYLDEIRAGVRHFDTDQRHFCLTAPFEVIRDRLIGRGEDPGGWSFRKARVCCEAHAGAGFGLHVATEGRSPEAVVAGIIGELGL